MAEDYLTLIWKAGEWPDDGRQPCTTDIAAALDVTLSTVSATLKKLAREGLIEYEPYGSIKLTGEGERIALGVVRRHRLIESFLVEQLEYGWDEVHEEADRLEHAASSLLIDRIDAALGFPETDPHGDRIPRWGGSPRVAAKLLATCDTGHTVRIVRVSDANPAILRYLTERDIAVDSILDVTAAMNGTGLMTVRHRSDAIEVSAPIAHAIHVAAAAAPSSPE